MAQHSLVHLTEKESNVEKNQEDDVDFKDW
jgi:hypothetical protein